MNQNLDFISKSMNQNLLERFRCNEKNERKLATGDDQNDMKAESIKY